MTTAHLCEIDVIAEYIQQCTTTTQPTTTTTEATTTTTAPTTTTTVGTTTTAAPTTTVVATTAPPTTINATPASAEIAFGGFPTLPFVLAGAALIGAGTAMVRRARFYK